MGIGGLMMKVEMQTVDRRELEHAALQIRGSGVGAMLSMLTSFDLSDQSDQTLMKWAADVRIAGPVGSVGQRVLQPIVNQQVAQVMNALKQQVRRRREPSGSAISGTTT